MAKTPKLTSGERETLIRSGFGSLVLEGAGGVATSPVWSKVAKTQADQNDRILVIVELSGGNDGLNTVIPYEDEAYYNARPNLGIRKDKLLRIDEQFGFQKTMGGFERLYKDGMMGIVHGVGYEQPSFSHFSSMAFWQTGAPNSGEAYGWLGRMADAIDPLGHTTNFLVNIDDSQSLAVRAMNHVPLVFNDPDNFTRHMFHEQQEAIVAIDARGNGSANPSQDFLFDIAASATHSEHLVRAAWNSYSTPIDYGLVKFGLERVAALTRWADPIVVVDHFVQAEALAQMCRKRGTTCRVILEVNIGMNRVGIRPGIAGGQQFVAGEDRIRPGHETERLRALGH